jgi:hypothetical protein
LSYRGTANFKLYSPVPYLTREDGQGNGELVAAEPGFEPGLEDPKSPVLPLHNSAFYNI